MKSKKAYNKHTIGLTVFFISVGVTMVVLMTVKQGWQPVILELAAVWAAVCLFIPLSSPTSYVFDDEAITINYLIWNNKIEWERISGISVHRESNGRGGTFLHYEIYGENVKKFFVKPTVCVNKETDALIAEYWCGR